MDKKLSLFMILIFISQSPLFRCCPKCEQKNEISASIRAPNDWGCPEENAIMTINFFDCDKTFNGTITASNLLVNHDYLLCINGKADHKSNNILKKKFNKTQDGKEGFYDFHSFRTDSLGNYSGGYNKSLPCGSYDVKFFVKDVAQQHCVVLMNQTDFIFTIEK